MSDKEKNVLDLKEKTQKETPNSTEEKNNSTEQEVISEEENTASAASEDSGKESISEDHKSETDTETSPASPEENSLRKKEKATEEPSPKENQKEAEETPSAEKEEKKAEKEDFDGVELKDYHSMEMPELIKELSRLIRTEKIQDIRQHVEEIKNEFNAKFEEEIEQKKEDFLEDGGNIIDFYYSSPLKKEFNSVYFDYKEKRSAYYKEIKKNLNKNLENRLAIIEELKGMIGLGESMNANFNQFKELQERWRKAGPIPRDKYNMVFKTYHHHVEHFYDFLHLDREFRDLDFKHNLEQKLKIIARAEELAQEPYSDRAFRELQMLHKMWKEDLGPVEKIYREEVWEKFSEATKKIHENRQAYFAEMDKKREENLEKKNEIVEKINQLAEGVFSSHNKTQQKIKELEKLRKEFFAAGKVPKKDTQKSWTLFKEATRNFNRKKNAFYKNLKKEQYENLDKKRELIKIAEENKNSTDFAVVTPLMKKIQEDWKKIGHVPRRESDKVWKEFKAACNHYFDQLHAAKDEENKEENEAFEQKKQMLEEFKTLEPTGNKEEDLAGVKSKIEDWKSIGRVPKYKNYIEKKFDQALSSYLEKIGLDGQEAELLKYENRIQALDSAEDTRKIEKEAAFLRKKIENTESEIRQFENNLQFFAHADQENPLVKEVHQNIARHKEKLETWKAKLRKVKAL